MSSRHIVSIAEPGRRYRKIVDLESGLPAQRCDRHRIETDGHGICEWCLSEWRELLGIDPSTWVDCRMCRMPLHPAAEVGGFKTCPSCDLPGPRSERKGERGVTCIRGCITVLRSALRGRPR